MRMGFLGCGHMGRAILAGLLDQHIIDSKDVLIHALKSAPMTAERYGVHVANPIEILRRCDVILLAIKPQQLHVVSTWIEEWQAEHKSERELTQGLDHEEILSPAEIKKTLIISLLAGTSLDQLQLLFSSDFQIARVMPNLPAQVGHGVTLCCASPSDPDRRRALQICHDLFTPLGHVEELNSESD